MKKELYEFIPEDMNEEEEEEDAFPEDEGRMLGMIRRTLHIDSALKVEEMENLVYTRCKIDDHTCNAIVDSGECTNVAFSNMLCVLKLSIRDQHRPYKLNWLDDNARIRVKKQALVAFLVGSYVDEQWCDVLPMRVCHLLLGRP